MNLQILTVTVDLLAHTPHAMDLHREVVEFSDFFRDSPANIGFEVCIDAHDIAHLLLIEKWSSFDEWQELLRDDAVAAYLQRITPLLARPAQVQTWLSSAT